MRFVALAFAAATFIGASCPNPVTPPPDVVTDSSVPDDATPPAPVCRCKPCPCVVDASPPAPSAVDAAPPAPKPTPSCQTACDSMRKNGCKEGVVSDCAAKLCAVNADPRFVHYDVSCLTAATTPGAIANCGMSCTQ